LAVHVYFFQNATVRLRRWIHPCSHSFYNLYGTMYCLKHEQQ
jgi:hypothetical protein